MKGLLLAALLSGVAVAAVPAWAQDHPCPHASEVRQSHLVGLWRAEMDGQGHVGTLLLEKHALYAQSVSGSINRGGERRPVAGDVEDGDFTLEESSDGVRISATWVGELVEGSCGKEIRGTWTLDGQAAGKAFVLRKE